MLTSRERVLTVLSGGIPDRVPWMENNISNEVAEALIGHDRFLHGTYSQKVVTPGMIRVPPEVRKVIPLDNLSYDLSPPRFAKTERIGGRDEVTAGLIKTKDDLKLLDTLPDPDDAALYRPIEEFLDRYKDDAAAVATVRTGVSNTYLSMGIDHFCASIVLDPGLVTECLERFSDWSRKVVVNLQELPFDLFFMPDDMGFGKSPMISPEAFRTFCVPVMRKVIGEMRLPAIYHSDGNILPLLDDIIGLGVAGVANFEPGPMDIEQVKRDYGHRITLMGNIDLHYTLTQGSAEETREEVRRRIEKVGPGGRYILASSNSLPNYVRPENVTAMGKAVLDFGAYPLNADGADTSAGTSGPAVVEIASSEVSPAVSPGGGVADSPTGDVLLTIRDAVIRCEKDRIMGLVQEALDAGIPPANIINDAMIVAMDMVGKEFSRGAIFVPEMLVAAMTMKSGVDMVKPLLRSGDVSVRGKVLLVTVKGDLHDIGKNIVAMMLEGAGFQVVDMGINMDEHRIVEKVREIEPDILGMSALLTTTLNEMGTVVETLTREGLRDRVKVMVGGAPVTREFCLKIGADGYGGDAAEAVEVAKRLMG